MLNLYIIQSILAKLDAGFKPVLNKTIPTYIFWLYLFSVVQKKKAFEILLLLTNILHGEMCCQQQSGCCARARTQLQQPKCWREWGSLEVRCWWTQLLSWDCQGRVQSHAWAFRPWIKSKERYCKVTFVSWASPPLLSELAICCKSRFFK